MAESEERLNKRLLMKVKEKSEKAGLKLSIKNIVVFCPITSRQVGGEKVEAVKDFIFLGFKITLDDSFNHEIKRQLLLGRKAMTNLESIVKSKHIILPTKFHILKAMVFPVVMYRCESWIMKKAQH